MSNKRSRNILGNQMAASIAELMIVVLITSIIALAAIGLLRISLDYFNSTMERSKTELELAQATFFLNTVVGQAVDVQGATAANIDGVNIGAFGAYGGRVRVYDSTTQGAGPNIDAVALFVRENGRDAPQLVETGIYFQRPTSNASGVLYFDLGDPSNADPALSPSFRDIYFGRFVEFQVLNPIMTNNHLQSVEFRLTMRHFVERKTNLWCWTPGGGGCPVTTPAYRDLTKVVKVALRNNIIDPASQQRLFGKMHFYKFVPSVQGM